MSSTTLLIVIPCILIVQTALVESVPINVPNEMISTLFAANSSLFLQWHPVYLQLKTDTNTKVTSSKKFQKNFKKITLETMPTNLPF